MKERLVIITKYFKPIYSLYFYICSFFVNVLRCFVKPDEKLILFISFGGKKYDDSPKAIYEEMINDSRFKDYKFVWAFHNPENVNINDAAVIKSDTYQYFWTVLKARCWITNSTVERGLNFKGKHTFYFNTWHGTPIKRMGSDIAEGNKSFAAKKRSKFDIMTVQGDFEAEVFSRAFKVPKENFLKCGLPRNDKLANYGEYEKIQLKKKWVYL